jgi:hypothetical protein
MKHVSGSGRRAALTGFAALAMAPSVSLLAGCSPTYDWREVRTEEGDCMVLMPGKPAKLTRPIDLAGLQVRMSMQGAQAADTAFTIAAVGLPEDSEPVRAAAIAAMRTGMVRNIGGVERDVREIRVPVVDTQGRTVAQVPGIEVEATGRMRDDDAALFARFVALGPKAWQCVVLGRRVEREPAATFLQSMRLVRA